MKTFNALEIKDYRGAIYVFEKDIDFQIKRFFYIDAPKGSQRGGHGHKKCKMILVCTYGRVEIIVNDGSGRKSVILDSLTKGLFLNPIDWHLMNFLEDSVLAVHASEKYDIEDYFYNEP